MILKIEQSLKSIKPWLESKFLWWGIIFAGIYLRLHLFFSHRSFWADEASLALNLVSKDFHGLTRLLDYHQAAPIGFLVIEKTLITVFGNYDYIMRLFPLFSGIATIFFAYYFSRRHLGSWGIFSLSLVSFSWWFIYYSSEMKQYSSDIMVATMLLFFAGRCFDEDARSWDFFLLAAVGSLAIWISHPSVFVLAGIGVTLLGAKIVSKEVVISWAWIFLIGTAWVSSFGLEYLVSLRHIIADGYLIEYWQKAYVPSPPWTNKAWYGKVLLYFLDYAYRRPDRLMSYLTLILTPLAVLAGFFRNRKILALLLLPFAFTYLASALHLYPLKDRFLLFLIPLFYFLLAEGIKGVFGIFSKINEPISVVISGGLALWIVFQGFSGIYQRIFLFQQVDVRPVLEYVGENKEAGDIVYVFYRTETVFRYYAPFYGLDDESVMMGRYDSRKKIALENYVEDVASLAGTGRVWFIFTEVADCPACEPEDTQSYYLDFVDPYGILLECVGGARSNSANAYLYDLDP